MLPTFSMTPPLPVPSAAFTWLLLLRERAFEHGDHFVLIYNLRHEYAEVGGLAKQTLKSQKSVKFK